MLDEKDIKEIMHKNSPFGVTSFGERPTIYLSQVAFHVICDMALQTLRLRKALSLLYKADRDFLSSDNVCVHCDGYPREEGHKEDCPVAIVCQALENTDGG